MISGQGTKIAQATWPKNGKKEKERNYVKAKIINTQIYCFPVISLQVTVILMLMVSDSGKKVHPMIHLLPAVCQVTSEWELQ